MIGEAMLVTELVVPVGSILALSGIAWGVHKFLQGRAILYDQQTRRLDAHATRLDGHKTKLDRVDEDRIETATWRAENKVPK